MATYLIYTGTKKELKLTRPELKEKYHFKGKEPVKVEKSDGAYLLKEFGRSFEETSEPAKKPAKKPDKPKKPTKVEIKAAEKATEDALSEMGADGPADTDETDAKE